MKRWTRVRLNDGVEFIVQSSVEKLRESVTVALDNNEMLEVKNGDGKMRIINPIQIVFFAEIDEPRAADIHLGLNNLSTVAGDC